MAGSSVEFACKVVELLESGPSREEIGTHGRKLVGTRFSWEASGRYLDRLVSDVGKKRKGQDPASDPDRIGAVLGG